MSNGDIIKENKTKKYVNPINFLNMWPGSSYKKHYTWKDHET
jgi:hypothetical protein